jgi:hypothetical protein
MFLGALVAPLSPFVNCECASARPPRDVYADPRPQGCDAKLDPTRGLPVNDSSPLR